MDERYMPPIMSQVSCWIVRTPYAYGAMQELLRGTPSRVVRYSDGADQALRGLRFDHVIVLEGPDNEAENAFVVDAQGRLTSGGRFYKF